MSESQLTQEAHFYSTGLILLRMTMWDLWCGRSQAFSVLVAAKVFMWMLPFYIFMFKKNGPNDGERETGFILNCSDVTSSRQKRHLLWNEWKLQSSSSFLSKEVWARGGSQMILSQLCAERLSQGVWTFKVILDLFLQSQVSKHSGDSFNTKEIMAKIVE
jgi:hypothetical protein